MRYFLLAGEASGDNLGALLIEEIRQLDSEAIFAFWGGDEMARISGLSPKQHIRELAFMGFVEVVVNLRRIRQLLATAKDEVAEFAPDALICIDYPGFNLRLAKWAKARGIWVDLYVSPQIWAWRSSRVHGIVRDVSRVLCILPFEPAFYKDYGYTVDFVGHPLPQRVDRHPKNVELRILPDDKVLPKGEKILALLPGSRKQEVRALLPVMLAAVKTFRELAVNEHWSVVIAAAPPLADSELAEITRDHDVGYVRSAYDLLAISNLACVASGSATLETALFGVPEVVCYRGNSISVALARRLVRVPFIALPNLILNRPVVPELIQSELTPASVAGQLLSLRTGELRERVETAYRELRASLIPYDAAAAAARLIVEGARKRT